MKTSISSVRRFCIAIIFTFLLQSCGGTTGGKSPAPNNLPIIQNISNQTYNEGDVVSLQITASDADGDTLGYSATGLPSGLTISPTSGNISGTLGGNVSASSPYSVEVVVSDSSDTSKVTFQWVVNDPSVIVTDAKYVSPAGSNSNNGSLNSPWASLKYAFSQLNAGDTLYLRGGIYWESSLTINTSGTSTNPVVITNYPSETPIIDGGLQDFRQVGNNDWEVVDVSINLYRSKLTFDLSDVAGKFYFDGKIYSLSRYEDIDDLSATNEFVGTGARYVGPGVFYNTSNDKIYIRLQPSSSQSLNGVSFNVPTNLDPRQNQIFLNDKNTGVGFSNSASHITFKGIDVAHHYHGLKGNSAENITISDLSITMNYTGILMEGGSHHILVDNVVFNAFFPPWVAWTDMKGSDGQYQPVPTVKPSGLSGTDMPLIHDVEIRNSLFNGVFDGQVIDGYNINIHHNSYTVLDDMTQLGTNSYNIEIHHNHIMGPGVSHNGRGDSSISPGTKYIHHNIIDSTTPILWGRHDPSGMLRSSYSGWHGQLPFPTHTGSGPGEGDPWKIYHNTILYDGEGHSGGAGFELWKSINNTGKAHEVYNNIFIQTNNKPIVDDQSTKNGLQVYDGNLYYRATGGSALFDDIEDSSGTPSYDSLGEFLASSTFVESKNFYAPGWESSSIEADPELNNNYLPATSSPAVSGALDIDSLGFPGLKGDVFRGATDSLGAENIGR